MGDSIPFTGIIKGSEDQSIIGKISKRTEGVLEGGGCSSNIDWRVKALFNALTSRTMNGGNNNLDLLLSITLPILSKTSINNSKRQNINRCKYNIPMDTTARRHEGVWEAFFNVIAAVE